MKARCWAWRHEGRHHCVVVVDGIVRANATSLTSQLEALDLALYGYDLWRSTEPERTDA